MKSTLHVILFLIGLMTAAACIRACDVMPFWSAARRKAIHYLENADQYDTLLLGSSRIDRGLIPSVFDKTTAEAGRPTHSLNLGIAGTLPHDTSTVLDWILSNKSKKLRQVIIELDCWHLQQRYDRWMTPLQVEMHDARHLTHRFRTAFTRMDGADGILRSLTWATSHSLTNYLRIGQAPRILRDQIRVARTGRLAPTKHLEELGYSELNTDTCRPHRLRQHLAWREDTAKVEKMLNSKMSNVHGKLVQTGISAFAVEEQARRLRAAGVEVYFVIMPRHSWMRGRTSVQQLQETVPVIALDSPRDHPNLYAPSLWFDSDHVLRDGAVAITKALADEFCRLP